MKLIAWFVLLGFCLLFMGASLKIGFLLLAGIFLILAPLAVGVVYYSYRVLLG